MKKLMSLILAAMLILMMGGAALADDTITVTGTATVQLEPDMVVIMLGVEAIDPVVLNAQKAVNETMAKVVEALTGEELAIAEEDIATAEYYINERHEYNYEEGKSEMIGYEATAMLSICVRDLEKAGAVIDAAMQAGANRLSGVEFMSSNQTEARDQALTIAVQDGMRKAKVIAAAAGIMLPKLPSSIVEQTGYAYAHTNSIVTFDMAAGAAMESSATTLQAGMLSLNATVQIVYEID